MADEVKPTAPWYAKLLAPIEKFWPIVVWAVVVILLQRFGLPAQSIPLPAVNVNVQTTDPNTKIEAKLVTPESK